MLCRWRRTRLASVGVRCAPPTTSTGCLAVVGWGRRYSVVVSGHPETEKDACEDRDDQAEAKRRVLDSSERVASWSAELNRRLSDT